jgi:hypothetical protein
MGSLHPLPLPSDDSATSSPCTSSTNDGDESLQFYFDNDAHSNPFPLWQPDSSSVGSLRPSDDTSITTELSEETIDSLFSNSSGDLIEPEIPIVEPPAQQATADPSRLNAAWTSFFRQSLIADDPAQPSLPQHHSQSGTPPDLPPPIRTAPNDLCGDSFVHKTRGSFRMWSVNAGGISSKKRLHRASHSVR